MGGGKWQAGGAERVAYILPRHPAEVDRLDVQHYAFLAAMGGNYLAPVNRPAAVLDVGCGTGQWAHELCAEFPSATVVGLDLVRGKPAQPSNYSFVLGNVLQGLPFAGGRFDFVHQRLLIPGIPVRWWSAVIEELVRVTRPGGWIELVEVAPWIASAGPATARLSELVWRLARAQGLDTTGLIFNSLDQRLRQAGIADVVLRGIDLPMGEWAGQVGSFMASDFRAVFTRLCDVFETRFDLPAQEGHDLVRAAQLEWEQHHSTLPLAVAYGMKPALR
jgi:SAM-dependent methyltransferase